MRDIRTFLCWMFALTGATCLWFVFLSVQPLFHANGAMLTARALLLISTLASMSGIFILAWWNIWRRNRSARIWGIAASLSYVLLAADGYLTHSKDSAFALIVGVAGVFLFWQREVQVSVKGE